MTQPSDAYELPEDLFGREAIAEKIKGLLESDIDLSPMVIDGDWGIGKTVFCQRLINKIKASNKLNCVYIDAFRADHIDDPLISIISEIGKLVEKDGREGELDSFIDGAKPFLRTAAKTLGKAAVSFALKQSTDDIAEGYDKEVEALAGAGIDASIDLVIRDKINAEKNLETLHEALKEVTKEKELVILIDELDRCRATFAIDMLETIKHAFSIPKVKVIIIANSSQLEAAFRHRYGSYDNTKNYFEKFYKYKYSLPLEKKKFKLGNHKKTTNSLKYLTTLISDSAIIPTNFSNKINNELDFENFIENNSISLREIEKIIKNIEIIFHFEEAEYIFNYHPDNSGFNFNISKFVLSFVGIYLYTKEPSLNFNDITIKNELEKILKNHDQNKKFMSHLLYIINLDEETDYEEDDFFYKSAKYLNLSTTNPKNKLFEVFGNIYRVLNFQLF